MIKDNNQLVDLLKYEYISFDIFDTLLIRPYINPYHLLLHIEKILQIKDFYETRMEAEHKARSHCDFEDITIEDIYSFLPDDYHYLLDWELKFEKILLKPNPKVLEIYNFVKNHNKKIIITSDMYLPKSFLEDVLVSNGFDSFTKFYLSSDIKLAKYTGNLFKYIINDLLVNPQDIIHIGDSLLSDVEQPKKLGIHTFHIPKISDQFFMAQENKRFEILYKNNPNSIEVSIVLAMLSEKYQFNDKFLNSKQEYWKDIGYFLGGTIGYSFCNFILHQIARSNAQQVLFVARDGFILKKIVDILQPNLQTLYIYAQRILRSRILLNYGDEHNADLLISVMSEKLTDLPCFQNFQEKEQWINSHIKLFQEESQKKSEAYLSYLQKTGVDLNKELLLVDTGAATFSAQKLIEHFYKKKLLGVYTIIANDWLASKGRIRYSIWAKKPESISFISSVIEFLFTSPEPPIADISISGPIFIKNVATEEYKKMEICPLITEGALDFVKDMKNRFGDFLISMNPCEINKIVRGFCINLNNLDREQFQSVYRATNASHTEYSKTILDQILDCLKEEEKSKLSRYKKIKLKISSKYKKYKSRIQRSLKCK